MRQGVGMRERQRRHKEASMMVWIFMLMYTVGLQDIQIPASYHPFVF